MFLIYKTHDPTPFLPRFKGTLGIYITDTHYKNGPA